MLDFERTKRSVSGRNILLTSWFDDRQQTWRANAPDYAYLGILLATRIDCVSRQAAVDRLCKVLSNHFENIVD